MAYLARHLSTILNYITTSLSTHLLNKNISSSRTPYLCCNKKHFISASHNNNNIIISSISEKNCLVLGQHRSLSSIIIIPYGGKHINRTGTHLTHQSIGAERESTSHLSLYTLFVLTYHRHHQNGATFLCLAFTIGEKFTAGKELMGYTILALVHHGGIWKRAGIKPHCCAIILFSFSLVYLNGRHCRLSTITITDHLHQDASRTFGFCLAS